MRLTEPPVRLAQMRPQIAWTPKVQEVMDKALQRDATLRYASANEFGRALSAAVKGLSTVVPSGTTKVLDEPEAWVPPTRVSATPSSMASTGRRMGRLATVAGIVVLVAGVLAYVATRGGSAADATTTTSSSTGTQAQAPAHPGTGSPDASPVAATSSQPRPPVPDPAAVMEDPLAIVPGARMPRTEPSRPAGTVTAPSGSQSYAVELRSLEESIADSGSAVNAMRQLSILKSRVTLASDVAAVQFVEAKATMLTAGAAKGCALMRRIKRENLGAGWREQFTEGLQTCEGN